MGGAYSAGNMKYLGLCHKDVVELGLDTQDLTPNDFTIGESLLTNPFFDLKKNIKYKNELETMLQTRKKAELQALYSKSTGYLATRYLPHKILNHEHL